MHRRTIGLAFVLLVAVSIGCLALQGCKKSAWARATAKTGMSCPMHGKMGKEQMMCTCPMHQMMGGPMTSKSMIATTDGGVVIMIGDKLMKFDRDLNLVQETKVEMNIEGTPEKPDQPMKECPSKKNVTKECPTKKDSEK
jgi:hypothetical protein